MQLLANSNVRVCLDDRWPRVLWYEQPKSGCRVPGEPQALAPRVYMFRAKDLATVTTDDDCVFAEYHLASVGGTAIYHAKVSVDDRPAAEFDVVVRLDGPDATIAFENVREFAGYYFLSIRFHRLVAACSRDADARVVTCGWQGRLLDPRVCKPNMTDYSWHGSVARHCGAAYRERFMVTFDMLGYEDLFIQEVRQQSRIAGAQTVASLGGELMHRQRTIEDPNLPLRRLPPPGKRPPVERLKIPLLCATRKQISLHFIAASKGRSLGWPDAARYFQSLLPKEWRCEPRYDKTVIYKNCVNLSRSGPLMTFEQAGELVRRIANLTDGMKQVCYITGMQPGGRGTPNSFDIDPAVGDAKRLRQLIAQGRRDNAVISMHDLPTQADVDGKYFDPKWVARDTLGRMRDAGLWDGIQLVEVSPPEFLKELKKIPARLVREFGLHETYHCDTFGGFPFGFDANPRHPHNATECNQANFEFVKELRRHGIDLTAESLCHAYVPWIGHVWALFNYAMTWEGEERVPFANYIYHGATSWNSGHGSIPLAWYGKTPTMEDAIVAGLIQGGGAGIEFSDQSTNPVAMIDALHLVQVPYAMLRNRKWTDYRRDGDTIRVQYGKDSFIEANVATFTYRVVVDGETIAKDFTTVYPGPKTGTYLAYSRTDCDLDWPAPRGWKNGPIKAVILTETDPGVTVPARVERGRLRLHLRAHQPVRLMK